MPHSHKARPSKKPAAAGRTPRTTARTLTRPARSPPAPGPDARTRSTLEHRGKRRKDGTRAGNGATGAMASADKAKPASALEDNRLASLTPLQASMRAKLAGAHFRYLNEQLYTRTSKDAWALLQERPELWREYHAGFAVQAQRWPEQPVERFIAQLARVNDRNLTIVDFGCGEAKLAAALEQQHTVHSFDLVAPNERVVACNMTAVPLPDACADVATFVLALMGTDVGAAVREGARVLRPGGLLKVAEVSSRFRSDEDVDTQGAASVGEFVAACESLGLKPMGKPDERGGYFVFFTFKRTRAPLPPPPRLSLKPCIYKRR